MSTTPIHGTVFADGTITLVARVEGHDRTPITPAAITAASYTLSLIDEEGVADQPVEGHTSVAVDVAGLILPALRCDSLWNDLDAVGYNFRHTLDVTTYPAFTARGRRYRMHWILQTATQPIVFDAILKAI